VVTTEQPFGKTLARFRELLIETMQRHLATSDALDGKAWQALGVGSLVLGLGIAGDLNGWGLAVALGAYGVLAYGAFQCIRIRGWKVTPEGEELWRDGWNLGAEDFDHTIVNALVKAEPHNRQLLREKAEAARIAIVGLGAEIAVLTIAAAVS
jgi:hypothetical protein